MNMILHPPELFVREKLHRPLLPLEVVMDRLDYWNSDAVLAAIELGRITHAFDISKPGAERREVRVFHKCVDAADNSDLRSPISDTQVFNEIIPTHWGRVRAASLQRRFWCSQQLVAALIEAGCFTALTEAARGADGSPEVTRESVIQFLSARKL